MISSLASESLGIASLGLRWGYSCDVNSGIDQSWFGLSIIFEFKGEFN
jgi:hypothetical protein